MKTMILSVLMGVCLTSVFAQSQGKIVFEEKTDLHMNIPPEREQMKEMIPQFRTARFELFYTADESIYKPVPQDDEEVVHQREGAQFRMRMTAPQREVYKNMAEDKMVDEREFMTKLFLIRGKASPFAWKIADGQKMILDYPCMKATWQDSTNAFVAWFAPGIPVHNGPEEFGGLPGMILQIESNNGQRTITAVELSNEAFDTSILQEPNKGKEVTQEEFRQIVDEKTKEMHQMHGSGGPMIMIRH